jgi:hypothetical protein
MDIREARKRIGYAYDCRDGNGMGLWGQIVPAVICAYIHASAIVVGLLARHRHTACGLRRWVVG